MKVNRMYLTDIFKCYSTTAMMIEGELTAIFATESQGPAYSFRGKNFEKQETVWEGPGGTMSIVPIPGRSQEFLAVQEFFPTFNAPESVIVWGKYEDGQWDIQKFIDLPYVHRFDLLEVEGVIYFVAGTLATSKKDKEDWSDPGKILVGILPKSADQPMELTAIQEKLTRHHGYSRGYWKGNRVGFFTADEGIYVATPPHAGQPEWNVEKLLDGRVSDVFVFDVDEDGEDEMITIEPFHGNEFNIRKFTGETYEKIFSYPHELDFAHVVWAGLFNGKPTIFGAARRVNKELFMIRYNKETKQYDVTELERGGGPSNIFVVNQPDGDLILCANREVGEAIIYKIEE